MEDQSHIVREMYNIFKLDFNENHLTLEEGCNSTKGFNKISFKENQ